MIPSRISCSQGSQNRKVCKADYKSGRKENITKLKEKAYFTLYTLNRKYLLNLPQKNSLIKKKEIKIIKNIPYNVIEIPCRNKKT